MERFLITGGQGFIGAWIVRQLLAEGERPVLLDLEPEDGILRQVLEPEQVLSLERRFGDVADAEFVREVLSTSAATRVIHLAGLQVPTCREQPVLGARVNVLGTLNVLEAAARVEQRVECVVYASSAAVAGPPEDYQAAISDDAVHRPRTHYGVFKLANEGNARVYWQDRGVPSVGLRPLAAYGVGREIGITSGPTRAIRAAVRGEDFTIPFTGMTGFNFASDLASVFIGCARRHREGAVALNTPGENHSVEEFVDAITECIPEARGKIRATGEALPIAWNFDESGLRALLGEVPHTPITQGIAQTADRFRELEDRQP